MIEMHQCKYNSVWYLGEVILNIEREGVGREEKMVCLRAQNKQDNNVPGTC